MYYVLMQRLDLKQSSTNTIHAANHYYYVELVGALRCSALAAVNN